MQVVDVRRFGAVGDGSASDTVALQSAFDACADSGGGVVELHDGVFRTGTLFLRSGVHLRIAPGAVLRGSTDIADYSDRTFRTMYKDEPHMDRCLLFADLAEDLEISGGGTIDGCGSREHFPNAGDPAANRPMLMRFVRCTGVRIHDIALRDPASWTTAFLFCSEIEIERVTVSSRANHNGDGFDFDGCRHVRVRSCDLDTSDDSICLQSSGTESPVCDVVIEDCTMRSRWAGIRVGLLSRGTITDVRVQRCSFEDIDDAAVKIQMCEGGTISHLLFRDLDMRRVRRPMFVTLCRQRAGADAPPGLPPLGRIGDVTLEDVRFHSDHEPERTVMFLSGDRDRPLERIRVARIRYSARGGVVEPSASAVPEFTEDVMGGWWPEFDLLGVASPASVVFARHVRGLTLEDVDPLLLEPDLRPPVVLEDVVLSEGTSGVEPDPGPTSGRTERADPPATGAPVRPWPGRR